MFEEDIKIIDSNKLYKLCKYYCRIKKSFHTLNKNKLNEYLTHLKHHIYFGGSNISQTDFEILNGLVNELINVIGDFNTKSNTNISLTGQLIDKLKTKLKDFDELNKLNQLNNNSSQEEIEKKNAEIERINEELENKNVELSNKDIIIKNKNDEIEKKKADLEKKYPGINEINKTITVYKDILDIINKNVNKINILKEDKNKIILENKKLNEELTQKKNSLETLEKKLCDNEKKITKLKTNLTNNSYLNLFQTNNENEIEIEKLTKISNTFKIPIKKIITTIKKIEIDIQEKQKQIQDLDAKIKSESDTDIDNLKSKIQTQTQADELNILINSIFKTIFEVLYSTDIANQIIKKSI